MTLHGAGMYGGLMACRQRHAACRKLSPRQGGGRVPWGSQPSCLPCLSPRRSPSLLVQLVEGIGAVVVHLQRPP